MGLITGCILIMFPPELGLISRGAYNQNFTVYHFSSFQNTVDGKKEEKDKEYIPNNSTCNTNYQMSRRSKKAKAEEV